MPPAAVIVAVPFAFVLQVVFTTVEVAVSAGGCVMVTVRVDVQPFKSVTVHT